MQQQYVAISATKAKIAVSLRGTVKNIGKKHLDIMFEKNPYMKGIYPGDTRAALEVFWLCEAQGEYFDISDPSNIVRDTIIIGNGNTVQTGYIPERAASAVNYAILSVRRNALIHQQSQL